MQKKAFVGQKPGEAAGMGKKRESGQGFLRGALVLLLAVGIVKVIGAFFKIPLNAIIGDVGMGYFGTAYTIYNPVFSLATAGFPVAIARLVSENKELGRYRDVRRLHAVSIPIFLLLGALACALMALGAAPFLALINRGDQNALPAVYVLAPAVLFGSMSAIYRGYYEGLGDMRPTALSEVAEAACKLVLGLFCASWVMDHAMEEYALQGTVLGQPAASEEYARSAALPWAAAGAILGVTAGSVLSLLVLLLYHRLRGDGIRPEQLRQSPAPAGRRKLVRALVRTAVPVALGALAVNLSSLVDTAFLQNRITAVMEQDGEVLLGLGSIFAAANTPINSMLQAVGRIDLPVKLLCVGLVIKVALNYALTSVPEINVMGAGVGTLVCYFFLTFFGLAALGKETNLPIPLFRLFGKPFLASLAAAAAGWNTAKLAERFVPQRAAALPAMAVFLIVYAFFVLFFRVLKKSDFSALPAGEKIAKILEKHHWIG